MNSVFRVSLNLSLALSVSFFRSFVLSFFFLSSFLSCNFRFASLQVPRRIFHAPVQCGPSKNAAGESLNETLLTYIKSYYEYHIMSYHVI